MSMEPKKAMRLILTLAVCMTLFSSCSLLGKGSSATDKKQIAAYLNGVGPDFEKSKDDLRVFGQEFTEDPDGIKEALDLINKSKKDFQARLESLKTYEVPEKPDELKAFHNSLQEYYEDAIKLLEEYGQVLNYSSQLFECIEPIEAAVSTDLGAAPSLEEVKIVVKDLKSSITESIAIAEKCTPPHYLSDSHTNFVTILGKFSIATDDFVYALQIADPLRMYATSYRYELLSNKLLRLSDEMNVEIDSQQASVNELGRKLEKAQDDLYKQLLLWQGQYGSED